MARLLLHPKKGVNPHLTFCTRCGGESELIVLVGKKDHKDTCRSCGIVHYGGADNGKCTCGSYQFDRVPLGEHERLPGGLCKACEEEAKQFKQLVAEGGIYWKCADCRQTGVIRGTSKLAKAVRKQMGIDPPAPCGIQFSKNPQQGMSCPACGIDSSSSSSTSNSTQ